jgi:hypothetical protein
VAKNILNNVMACFLGEKIEELALLFEWACGRVRRTIAHILMYVVVSDNGLGQSVRSNQD